ncbi:hypothetical protein P4E94_08010 [Pontiellaceae bacterium B12219]|nr:hypothetical protein [Pontiellaceae bacterium B12219]
MNEIPRISANKLGEYMNATVSRRRQIIKDQKSPKKFKAAYYRPAQNALSKYISGEWALPQLFDKLAVLHDGSDGREYQNRVKGCSAGAIEAFLANYEDFSFPGRVNSVSSFSSMAMDLNGVMISVRPDLLLENADDSEVVGAVKFHFSKSVPLGDVGSDYVALILRLYLEEEIGVKNVDPKKCIVLDIHDGNLRFAPKSFVKRKRDIQAACDEIRSGWETI